MKYASLNIQNFRGIQELKISGLGQVNLFVGRNNCGKTSILEALFMLSGMSNPRTPLTINNLRDFILSDDEDFRTLFHDMDIDHPVVLESEGNSVRKLSLTPVFDLDEIRQDPALLIAHERPGTLASFSTSAAPRKVEGLRMQFSKDGKQFSPAMGSLRGNLARDSTEYIEEISGFFLNSTTFKVSLGKALETLLVQKRLPEILSILQIVEPRCIDLRMGAGEAIFVDIGADRLLPINILGDGFRRILTFLAVLNQSRGGVLLVDEIEIGLHYSLLVPLWKVVFAACKQHDVQLFATTHSYECIEAFSRAQREQEYAHAQFFRIDRDGARHEAFRLDPETLQAGLDKRFEVR